MTIKFIVSVNICIKINYGIYSCHCLARCPSGKFAEMFIISLSLCGGFRGGGSYEAIILQAETDRKAPLASSKITAIKDIPMA